MEFAPVKFSLGDDSGAQARGTIEYLRRISGIDPSKARSKFKRHIAGAIGDLSKEITSEVKKAVEDLTKQGIHLRGGKARIQEILARHNVQVTNTPALAETLFRTQSQQAYAAGRWNTVNDSDFGDYIWGVEYVTAGDDRVREGHRVLEGVRLPKEDPFWKKYFPPNGWNCRCTTLEIWKDESTAKIDFGITGRDPRKRTSDAMNVPKEFRGNVGIFASGRAPKKNEYKKIKGLEKGSILPVPNDIKQGRQWGVLRTVNVGETQTIQELISLGYSLKMIPESRVQGQKTPDIWLWGKNRKKAKKVEIKSITTSNEKTIKKHISKAIDQGCEIILLDMRNSPIDKNEIDTIIRKSVGSRPSRKLSVSLEVWLNNGEKYFRRQG